MSDSNACDLNASSASRSVDSGLQPPPSAPPVYGDAYVTHFTLVLRTIAQERPDFRRLYSPKELALAEHFLDRLTPLEQHVYARLFQRKGPWFKTSSLLSYFTRRPWKPVETEALSSAHAVPTSNEPAEDDAADATEVEPIPEPEVIPTGAESVLGFLPEVADHRQVQTTIQTLVNAGLLLTPTLVSPVFLSQHDQDAHLLLALEAIQQSATSAELTALWKKLSGGKTKISPASGRNTTSTSPLRSRKTADNSNDTTPTPMGNGSSKGEVFDAIKRLVMTQRRVDGSRIPVAKLMHAIWLESYPLLQQRNLKDEIILVVRISDAARQLFSRMHRLFYFQATMPNANTSSSQISMSAASRVKSFEQIVQAKSGASRTGMDALTYAQSSSSLTQQWPGLLVIFKKVQYPSYEITIRHPIFQSAETYICYEIASRLHRLVNGLEMEMVLTPVAKEEDTVPPDWSLSNDVFEQLPELNAFQRLVLPPAETAVPDEWHGRACAQFETLLLEWKALDELVLEARKCLRAYSYFHRQNAAQDLETDRPLFFVKCNAGYHLSRVLHHATSLYEKQRQYARAIVILRDLLASPVFLVRKRAYWYDRLAVNCEHLKDHSEAKRVCEQALNDKDVLGAGLIGIQRRLERLSRRKDLQMGITAKIEEEEIAVGTKRKVDHDKDDFIDLVSSNEEEIDVLTTETTQIVAKGETVVKIGVAGDLSPASKFGPEYPQYFIVGRPLNKSTGEKSRFIGYDDEPCDVEQLVLQYYHTQVDEVHTTGAAWYGVHCEGRVLINIFGLFMWDVMYASVPDVFQSAYQTAPLDFGFAKVFYEARRDQIDKLLDDIEHHMTMEDVLTLLATSWRAHEGQTSRFVSWSDTMTLRFHQVVVAAMGRRPLAKLLRHMSTSEEFHRAQNGLPDLLMVRVRAQTTPCDTFSDFMHSNPSGDARFLDVYKYCGMTCSMNLNGNANGREYTRPEGDDKEPQSDAADSLNRVQDLVSDTAAWQLELKLVEVKGPRDRLSDQQERWLQLFITELDIDASVMHVVEEEKELEKRRQRMNGCVKTKSMQTKAKKAKTGKK